MGRRFGLWARLLLAAPFALAVLVLPGDRPDASIARAGGCPSAPIKIAEIVNLDGVSPVTCFGGTLLTFRAFIPVPEGLGGTNAYSIAPTWLDDWAGSWVLLSAGPGRASTVAFVPPALGRCQADPAGPHCPFRPYANRWATVSAHYDGPVAQTCRYASHPPGKGYSKHAAVAECRAKLIVLSVGPDSLPATDAVAAPEAEPRGAPAAPVWFIAFGVGSLLLAFRRQAVRRR
jgi:hypothetical protein